jgi:hypothetical protein
MIVEGSHMHLAHRQFAQMITFTYSSLTLAPSTWRAICTLRLRTCGGTQTAAPNRRKPSCSARWFVR